MLIEDKKEQTLEEFFRDFSLSLAFSIIYSVNQNIKHENRQPEVINFYGMEDDFLMLISNRIKKNLGLDSTIYGRIPMVFNNSNKDNSYHIDVGWFFSIYNKNKKVEFYNLAGPYSL